MPFYPAADYHKLMGSPEALAVVTMHVLVRPPQMGKTAGGWVGGLPGNKGVVELIYSINSTSSRKGGVVRMASIAAIMAAALKAQACP